MHYENPVTYDLSNFGQYERENAAKLIKFYGTRRDITRFRIDEGGQGVFNSNSGCVLLTDDHYNTAILTTDENWDTFLVDFLNCPECGYENNALDFMTDCDSECCVEFADELGLE